MFSSRVPSSLVGNALSRAVARRREHGPAFVDLTESNPTTTFGYDVALLARLADPAVLGYEPHAFGLPSARAAVAGDYGRRGIAVAPQRVVLTASSSESYSFLFKLLCDPGDNVLVPVPSYPLFEHLAALDAVEIRPYALEFHGRWTHEISALERAADRRTRAVLVVSPNNPTGSRLRRDELHAFDAFCAGRELALVGDEVFTDYPLVDLPDAAASVLEAERCLAVSLGGLSKSVGLPQLKLGWMAFSGPDALVDAAMERMEIVGDTYLSVSAPVQVALPSLLERGASVRAQIADRVLLNDAALRRVAAEHPACRVLPVEGGWSAVIQAPAFEDDEHTALALLERADVLVHPGYFFDFPRDGFLVLSLIVEPAAFAGAVRRLFRALDEPGR
jgi:aspartate/methionine/tyrosine aminotransferase